LCLLKKVALLFCPSEERKTSQVFSRTYKQNSRLSRTAKNPGIFQDVATLQFMNRIESLLKFAGIKFEF